MAIRPTRHDVLVAGVTVGAALGALACTLPLRAAAHLGPQVCVLAVVLTLTFRRVPHHGWRQRAVAAVEVPAVAVAAGGVGWLLVHERWVGAPLLVLGLSIGIYARRFAAPVRAAGRLAALPFVALLVTPAVVGPPHGAAVLWAALVALIAFAWSLLPGALEHATTAAPAPAASRRRRLDAPTRMALQMACGVGVALVVGDAFFGREWAWPVISAFLVQSGNRGRGDVVHKAGLRVVGGVLGTAVASVGAIGLPSGHEILLVALFVIMVGALALRPVSYAWWAAGVTAMMALLHAYYGQSGHYVLTDRLVGILVGSALGVGAAWFVLPVRTADVLRRRIADCLAALTDDLAPDAGPPAFPAALARLDELTPTLRAHRRTAGRAATAHVLDAIDALHALEPPPGDPQERRRLRHATVRVRRAMVGRDDPRADELPAELATVHAVLSSHDAHSTRLATTQSEAASS